MKISIRFLIPVIFFFFIFIILAVTGAFESSYARITALEYRAEIIDTAKSYGKVKITERLTFEISAAYENIWELWRDLPEETVDGVKVSYNVLSVKRLTVNGQPAYLEFQKANMLYEDDSDYLNGPNKWYHSKGPYDGEYNFECLLIYVNGLYEETDVFEIEYEMYNASMRYGDCAELYLSLFSGDSVNHLKLVKGQILVPQNKMPAAGNYDAHTYGTDSHSFAFIESDIINPGYRTFSFELNERQLKFKPYNQYIEFALVAHGADKHKFSEFASKNQLYNTNMYALLQKEQANYDALPAHYNTVKLVVLICFIIISLLLLSIPFLRNKRIKKKYKFYTPEVNFKKFREVPDQLDTNLAGALVFCKHKLTDNIPGAYSALILSLVKKRYIAVERLNPNGEWKESNIKITLNQESAATLPQLNGSEFAFLNLIRRHSPKGEITFAAFQKAVARDYQNTSNFVDNMKSSVKQNGLSKGYFKELNYKQLKVNEVCTALVFIVLGVIITVIANIISFQTRLDLAYGAFFILGASFIGIAILSLLFARKYVLLTQLGENEYVKWRGLYNFLQDETLMKEQTVDKIEMWEDYLIYATAFGIPEKVLKAIEGKFPDYMQNSRIVGHPFLCRPHFVFYSSRSFNSSTRTAVSASRSISRSGGGYGGGGRGGGGGGGGH